MSDYQNHQPIEETTPVGEATPDGTAMGPESVEKPKESTASFLYDFLEVIVFSVVTALLLFTLFFRVCRVDGSSMRNTLFHSEMLITSNLAKVEAGDIVVFHQTSDVYERFNEAIVKRVIATEGQLVEIDF